MAGSSSSFLGRVENTWNRISLRSKITAVTVFVLALGLLLSGLGTTWLFRPHLLQQLDRQLTAASEPSSITGMLQTLKSGDSTPADNGGSGEYFIAIYNSSGKLIQTSWDDASRTPYPEIPATMTPAQGDSCAKHSAFDLSGSDHDQVFRAVCRSVTVMSGGITGIGTVIVATSTEWINSAMASYLAIFLGFGVCIILFGGLLTRLLVTSAFTPLRAVERTAAAIAGGDFSQRLGATEPNTEVGRLNRSLNAMLNRIDGSLKDRARSIEQMRRFIGDASHELRTPLVTVRGYAELYRAGALTTPEQVKEAMGRIENEAIRMGGLVEDLLELARLDETKPLELAPVDLLALAHDAAMDAGAVNPDRSFKVIEAPLAGLDGGLTGHSAPPASVVHLSGLGTAANTSSVQTEGAASSATRGHERGDSETQNALQTVQDVASADPERDGNTAGFNNTGNVVDFGTHGTNAAVRLTTANGSEESASESDNCDDPSIEVAAGVGAGLGRGDDTDTRTKEPRERRASTATGQFMLRGALGAFSRLGRDRGRRNTTAEVERISPEPLEPEPAVVLGVADKLRQVLANLITNATRYTPAGTPIEIGVATDPAARLAYLEIIDHGEGVPPELRERIFQRFWRADASRTRETGGSGLGLAIVASIVEAHRGTVTVIETPGGGATFCVVLPLAPLARPHAGGASDSISRELSSGDTRPIPILFPSRRKSAGFVAK